MIYILFTKTGILDISVSAMLILQDGKRRKQDEYMEVSSMRTELNNENRNENRKENRNNGRRARMRNGIALLSILTVMAASLAGCGEEKREAVTERAPIDKAKNVRNLVERAEQEPDTGAVDIATDGASVETGEAAPMKEIGHYAVHLQSENKKLTVDVDAPVKTAECDGYPVLSVTRRKVDDELLKKIKEMLLGDAKLYDGTRLIAPEIEGMRKRGEDIGDAADYEGQISYSEVTKYPVEPKLSVVKDQADAYKDMPNYKDYYMQLMPEGERFYGVTDGKDGTYSTLEVTNSDSYGSSLKFFRNSDYLITGGLVLPGLEIYRWPVEKGQDYIMSEENLMRPLEVPELMKEITSENGESYAEGLGPDPNYKGYKVELSTKETNQIKKEDAIKQAQEFLAKAGLTGDMAPVSVEDVYFTDARQDIKTPQADGSYTYNFKTGRAWHIYFTRMINGNELQNFGDMYYERSTAGGVDKKVWFGEEIEVYVNDNGVIGLSVNNLLNVAEQVVDNSTLMDFEKIKEIYEQSQLETLNRSTSFDSIMSAGPENEESFTFKIDDISLKYTRVAEQNNFQRGLLVPVWTFSGTCYDKGGKEYTSGSFIEINAIDGSVYNAEAGY